MSDLNDETRPTQNRPIQEPEVIKAPPQSGHNPVNGGMAFEEHVGEFFKALLLVYKHGMILWVGIKAMNNSINKN